MCDLGSIVSHGFGSFIWEIKNQIMYIYVYTHATVSKSDFYTSRILWFLEFQFVYLFYHWFLHHWDLFFPIFLRMVRLKSKFLSFSSVLFAVLALEDECIRMPFQSIRIPLHQNPDASLRIRILSLQQN